MRPRFPAKSFVTALLVGAVACAGIGPFRGRISGARFASLIEAMSGPGAEFDSDNLVSNESSYLDIAGQLERLVTKGGAYLGVGPSQNFSYIALTRPDIAFIVDVRRKNLLHHLIFKAIFEMAASPAEFLAIELSRPIPSREAESLAETVAALDAAPADESAYRENLTAIQSRIRERYLPSATAADMASVADILRAFFERGLDIRYEQPRFDAQLDVIRIPNYRNFLLTVGPAGRWRNFLADPDDFAFVKELQRRNRVIPLVGDFAGDVALRSVGRYLAARDQRVSAFYLSNVEYYLLPQGRLGPFVANLGQLPHDEDTLLIRNFIDIAARWHPAAIDERMSVTVLQTLPHFVERARSGRGYFSYREIMTDYLRPARSDSAADHSP